MTRPFLASLSMPLAYLCLAGCVGGLLGGGKPAQLYRFGSATIAAPIPTTGSPPVSVTLMPIQFSPEIEGDRILASDGVRTYYIKDARWIAPTPALFEHTLRDAFRVRVPSVTLLDRRDAIDADVALQINVERFEVSYASPTSIPSILIDARVTLINTKSHLPEASFFLQDSQLAAANGIGAVVAAFDTASTRSAAKIADWANGATSGPKGLAPTS